MKKFWLLFIIIFFTAIAFPQNAWINEFHYDNSGTDVGEFVEIVIENSASYTLSDFQVDSYNGNGGASYGSKTVDNLTVGSTSGNYTFYYWDIPGIQNGAPDGLALSYLGSVITGQFLSYEGSFTATSGPANGLTSNDIGVFEGGEPAGNSLQLGGTGSQYSDFTWNGPATETKGNINNNQNFGVVTAPTLIANPIILSGFNYVDGSGPSVSKSYSLRGSNLNPADGNITVTGSPNYEVSTDNSTFSNSLDVAYTNEALSDTTIYVRLMSGLSVGTYDGETILNAGGSAKSVNVMVSGSVSALSPSGAFSVEDFDYPAGDILTNHDWNQTGTSTSNPISVVSPGLSYTEYASSGIGNATSLTTSGQDINKVYPRSVTTGSVYVTFMVNVTSAKSAGDYFLHLGVDPTNTFDFFARTFVKLATNGNLSFGIAKNSINASNPVIYSDSIYTIGTTYLLVTKYTFNNGAANDTVHLFINPDISDVEPSPNLSAATTTAQDDAVSLVTVNLRQGGASYAPNVIVDGIRVDTTWNKVFGIVSVVGITESKIPSDYSLTQNYPNPFNPVTTIRFAVPKSQKVELNVYDILGRKVKEIYNNIAPAGTLTVEFKADDLASGMYIYRLKTDNFSASKKMILLK